MRRRGGSGMIIRRRILGLSRGQMTFIIGTARRSVSRRRDAIGRTGTIGFPIRIRLIRSGRGMRRFIFRIPTRMDGRIRARFAG